MKIVAHKSQGMDLLIRLRLIHIDAIRPSKKTHFLPPDIQALRVSPPTIL